MAFPIMAAALGLAGFVPIIARWLGNEKSQEVAAKVIDIAQQITNTQTPAAAIEQLQENTEMVKSFQKAILQLDADIELNLIKDRQDARMRDLAFVHAGRSNKRADVMVIAAAIGLILCLGSLSCFSGKLSGEAIGIISTIAGIFGACLKDAYTFEFGSSRGSKEKDSTVAAIMERVNL